VDPGLRARVERLLGEAVSRATRATRGYTPAGRWVVELADGRSAFVKAAVDDMTAGWLRSEHRIYATLARPFVPRLLGWDEADGPPVLVLEDLSAAHWPPPWRPGDVDAVLRTLDDMHAVAPPDGLPALRHVLELDGWARVAAAPGAFLSLGLVSAAWLDQAIDQLVAAEAAADPDGRSLLHVDVRSDNLCLRDARALLVDWNHACVGNPVFDVAFWLPSLELEGGPPPESILGDAPHAVAVIAGYFAARAGLPPIPSAPGVRPIQVAQLRSALPWAVRALGLEPLG
jgi:hypothetical protein